MGLNNSGSGDWISAIASSAQSYSKLASVRDFAAPNQPLCGNLLQIKIQSLKNEPYGLIF
jgi:hypothetical protein